MADLVTVRIPELPAYSVFGNLSLNDKIPVWMSVPNKTVWTDIAYLRSFFESAGGVSHTPVVSGNSMIATVSAFEAGGKIFSIPSIAGKDFVLRRGVVGAMNPATEYEILDAGGFKLLKADDKLWQGETFELEFYSSVPASSTPGTASGASLFTGVLPVSSSTTLGPSDIGKLVQIRGGSTAVLLSLPDLLTIPDNSIIVIETLINNSKQHTITTQSDQKIYFSNTSHTIMHIAPGEVLWLLKCEDGYYLLSSQGNFETVGDVSYGYKVGLNEVVMDGSIVNRADLPRLFTWAQSIGGSMVTDTDWLSSIDYRGCFSLGDNSLTFRLPDHMNKTMRAVKSLIGSDADRPVNKPGGYQADENKEHDHGLGYFRNDAQGGSQPNFFYLAGDNGAAANGDGAYVTKKSGGTESRMKNIGMLPKIKC